MAEIKPISIKDIMIVVHHRTEVFVEHLPIVLVHKEVYEAMINKLKETNVNQRN